MQDLHCPRVLDVCCGSRAFWFDRENPDAIFCDNRDEDIVLDDRTLSIHPDVLCDFRELPFADETFPLVVFDPPHTTHSGKTGWLRKKYGCLEKDWRDELKKAFSECFRVLRPDGVLIFKWAETEIPVSQIIPLAPAPPLFGHRSGRQSKTHWMTFIKPRTESGHEDTYAKSGGTA